MEYTVTEYREGFFILDDGRVRQFLFPGEEEAVLVDTGFGDLDLKAEVSRLTDKPVKVVLTHADMDHTGGLKEFDACYVHSKDVHMIEAPVELRELAEGDEICVGEYRWEVLHTPGHTYGSISLLDRGKKILLPGDSVMKGDAIFMSGAERNIDLYLESMRKLSAMKSEIEIVIPCHGQYPIGPEYIDYCIRDMQAYREGKLSAEKHPFMPGDVYKGEHVEFLM